MTEHDALRTAVHRAADAVDVSPYPPERPQRDGGRFARRRTVRLAGALAAAAAIVVVALVVDPFDRSAEVDVRSDQPPDSPEQTPVSPSTSGPTPVVGGLRNGIPHLGSMPLEYPRGGPLEVVDELVLPDVAIGPVDAGEFLDLEPPGGWNDLAVFTTSAPGWPIGGQPFYAAISTEADRSPQGAVTRFILAGYSASSVRDDGSEPAIVNAEDGTSWVLRSLDVPTGPAVAAFGEPTDGQLVLLFVGLEPAEWRRVLTSAPTANPGLLDALPGAPDDLTDWRRIGPTTASPTTATHLWQNPAGPSAPGAFDPLVAVDLVSAATDPTVSLLAGVSPYGFEQPTDLMPRCETTSAATVCLRVGVAPGTESPVLMQLFVHRDGTLAVAASEVLDSVIDLSPEDARNDLQAQLDGLADLLESLQTPSTGG